MALANPRANVHKLDSIIEPMLQAARIPGGATAVVAEGRMLYAQGFGHQDLRRRRRVTAETIYPIASTSKAINATLLGMLAEERRIEWDARVQRYLPQFRLRDPLASERVTVRDLVTMRTGLPRHDWVWVDHEGSRAELIARIAHLDLSADFRERFQYCNLSASAAGHVAEVVTGERWEVLVRERIFRPLAMHRTTCQRPRHSEVTGSFHENSRRRLLPSRRFATESIAPAGGAIYSNLADMSRWMAFNLSDGKAGRRRLISAQGLAHLHTPNVVIGDRPLTRFPPDGAYALGWLVDHYNGHKRLSHGGYLHDLQSSIMLFPDMGIGLISFINFGSPRIADLINQYAFDALMGLTTAQTLEQRLAEYEARVQETRKRNASVLRIANTRPSRPLREYAGEYTHPGYGDIKVERSERGLVLQRRTLRLPLRHWHYDVWTAKESDMWPVDLPHAFERASPLQFHSNPDGSMASLSIPLEAAVEPIRFLKR